MMKVLPAGMNAYHMQLLADLNGEGECDYAIFREVCNPWRREGYFDGQMKRLAGKGFVLFTNTKTIEITEAGRVLHQGR
jgi:hypothetical protein